MTQAGAVFAALLGALLAVAGCTGHSNAPSSLSFDADSDKAVVILGASVWWEDEYRDPDQSFALHWQAFDPRTLRLLPEVGGFSGLVRDAVRQSRDDPRPWPQVLLVEPGSYALVAAGSGVSKTFFVPVQERYRNKWGHIRVNDLHVDPLKYIEPRAQLAYGRHGMFSVAAGQIVYLGHFEFTRISRYLGPTRWNRRFEDPAAAREALAAYPGITGTVITLDPTRPPQSVAR